MLGQVRAAHLRVTIWKRNRRLVEWHDYQSVCGEW